MSRGNYECGQMLLSNLSQMWNDAFSGSVTLFQAEKFGGGEADLWGGNCFNDSSVSNS